MFPKKIKNHIKFFFYQIQILPKFLQITPKKKKKKKNQPSVWLNIHFM
jgi:hypothetical protein